MRSKSATILWIAYLLPEVACSSPPSPTSPVKPLPPCRDFVDADELPPRQKTDDPSLIRLSIQAVDVQPVPGEPPVSGHVEVTLHNVSSTSLWVNQADAVTLALRHAITGAPPEAIPCTQRNFRSYYHYTVIPPWGKITTLIAIDCLSLVDHGPWKITATHYDATNRPAEPPPDIRWFYGRVSSNTISVELTPVSL